MVSSFKSLSLGFIFLVFFPFYLQAQTKVLFLGVMNGVPEKDFVKKIIEGHFHRQYSAQEILLTSYQEAPAEFALLNKSDYSTREYVNATALHTDARFKNQAFDFIVWIGPTNDDDLSETSSLVEAFFQSARKVLSANGFVAVVQSLDTPNFRGIISINAPLQYLGRISLEERTQTKGKSLVGRKDDVFISPSDQALVSRPNTFSIITQGDYLLGTLNSICSAPKAYFPKGSFFEDKMKLVDFIFQMASDL
jgi:hypothetical protein